MSTFVMATDISFFALARSKGAYKRCIGPRRSQSCYFILLIWQRGGNIMLSIIVTSSTRLVAQVERPRTKAFPVSSLTVPNTMECITNIKINLYWQQMSKETATHRHAWYGCCVNLLLVAYVEPIVWVDLERFWVPVVYFNVGITYSTVPHIFDSALPPSLISGAPLLELQHSGLYTYCHIFCFNFVT